MRLLRLIRPGSFAIELHPYVTVVQGLEDDQRAELIAAFEAAARGDTAGFEGLMEAHGMVLDFDPASLQLLDLALTDVDVVVRPDDLPGSAAAGIRRQVRAAERRLTDLRIDHDAARAAADEAVAAVEAAAAKRDEARQRSRAAAAALDDGVQRIEALGVDLVHAQARLEELAAPVRDAAMAVAELTDAHAASVERRDQARAARAEIVAEIEAVESDLAEAKEQRDPFASAAHEAAVLQRDEIVAEVDAELESIRQQELADAAAQEVERPEDVIARSGAEIAEIDERLSMFEMFDPEPVREALDVVRRGPDDSMMVPSAVALGLAEQLETVERAIAHHDAVEVPPPADIVEAREAVDDAREQLFEVEDRGAGPRIRPEDVAALEAAHEEVLQALDKVGGRFGAARAEKRLEEAKAAEDALLGRLGFATYSDYMMGTSILRPEDGTEEQQIERARGVLAAAEQRLESLQRLVDAELEMAEFMERRRSLRADAREMVGGEVDDHQLVIALQAVRIPDQSGPVPVAELREALVRVGLAAGDPMLDEDDLAELADDWLEEFQATLALREELATRRSALIAERDDAIVRRDSPAAPTTPITEREQALAARVHEAEASVTEAASRRSAHDAAERKVADCLRRIDQLQELTTERVAAIDAARMEESAAKDELDAARARQRDREAAAEAQQIEIDRITAERSAIESSLHEAEVTDFETEIADAEDLVGAVEATAEAAQDRLGRAKAAHDEVAEEAAALRAAADEASVEAPPAEEIEWYLLARLAGQRQVSFAGSVPLVVDDALSSLDPSALRHILDRLERMAGAVQVVHLSDDPTIAEWAREAGEDRVAIVVPTEPRQLVGST